MNAFEVTEIKQIWDIFFMPLMSTVSVFLFAYVLFGKECIHTMYEKYQFVKIDDVYYRKKYIKIKNDAEKAREKFLLLPIRCISQKAITAVQNPVVFITCLFLVVYIVYRVVEFCSTIYPIRYSFTGENLLLYSTPKFTIAQIWTFFPDYTLNELYEKINIWGSECSYAEYMDYSVIHLFVSIFEFNSVLCMINMFIHKPKFSVYVRSLFMLIFCIGTIYCCFYLQFQKDASVLEQKAYYVNQQLGLEDPLKSKNTEAFDYAMERVENELSYANHHSYEIFHIQIIIPRLREGNKESIADNRNLSV